MLDSGIQLAVNPPSADAALEHKACWDLVERIVSDRLWLTEVKTVTEVKLSLAVKPFGCHCQWIVL